MVEMGLYTLCPITDFLNMYANLSESIREVVLVISDHGVPAVHQKANMGSFSCPADVLRVGGSGLKAGVLTGTTAI